MIKLFTHTDFDGIGCAIVAKIYYGEDDVDVAYCDYNNINEKVKEYLLSDKYKINNLVYITDIPVNKETAEYIDSIEGHNIRLIDHHLTNDFLNKYYWAESTFEIDGEKTCASSLFSYFLTKWTDGINISIAADLEKFTELVRKYDTWLWKEVYNDITPKKWNDLLYLIGRDTFVSNTYDKIRTCDLRLLNNELELLKCKQKEIDDYIYQKSKMIIEKDILGYKAGVVFAEQYGSELGNTLAEMNPELDFIVIINAAKAIGYRTIRKDINLGKDVASKFFNGGGHPMAAGSELPENFHNDIIDKLFNLKTL